MNECGHVPIKLYFPKPTGGRLDRSRIRVGCLPRDAPMLHALQVTVDGVLGPPGAPDSQLEPAPAPKRHVL